MVCPLGSRLGRCGVWRVVSLLVFLLVQTTLLFGQATPCCNTPTNTWSPPASPVNMVPNPGNTWNQPNNTFPNQGTSWSPTNNPHSNTGNMPGPFGTNSVGSIVNAPNPNTQPPIEQRAWYVNNNPAFNGLDPGIKSAIIYSGAGSGLLNSSYLPNGRPNPFVSSSGIPQPNWYL